MNELDKHLNDVKEMLNNEINRNKDIIFKGLLDEPLINKIPESLFVNYFLPCFLGKSDNPNWVMEWVSIAGTPMAEVAVFKDGTNEILYHVPSLLYTNNLFMYNKDGNLSDIFARYKQINNNLPISGMSFLSEALNSKNHELFSQFNIKNVNDVWMYILRKYNLINETVSDIQQDNLNDYLDF